MALDRLTKLFVESRVKFRVKGVKVSTLMVFKCIRAPALVELQLSHINCNVLPHRGPSNSELVDFKRFLKASPKLESLKVNPEFLRGMTPGFPFKLKKIIWSLSLNTPSWNFSGNVKEFFLSQAETLETIESFCEDSEFHKTVLTEFPRLKSLKTNLHKLNASEEFYRNVTPMPTFREIESVAGFSSEAAMRAVLSNCPGLWKLDCIEDQVLPNQLDFIAHHNKNLKALKIFAIRKTNASFQFLNSLTLNRIENIDRLFDFLMVNSTIETFHVLNLSRHELTDPSIKTLIYGFSFKHVTLNVTKPVAEDIYRNLKLHGTGTWESLELSASSEERVSGHSLNIKTAEFSFKFHHGWLLFEDLFCNEFISREKNIAL